MAMEITISSAFDVNRFLRVSVRIELEFVPFNNCVFFSVGFSWRIAANILNKQSGTADQEWSSSLGVWRKANHLTL